MNFQLKLVNFALKMMNLLASAATHNHPMWSNWDFAADMCLAQLPRLRTHPQSYKPSTFFQEQLTAFEVWLSFGAAEKRSQPEQVRI